jgi:RNA polymerase sigma-70 factor (ECF subfamily)
MNKQMAAALDADFHGLYRECCGYVYNTLVRLGAAGEAEDLSHEVFLAAFRRWSSYDRSRPPQPWLFGIAYRVASDFRRRAQSRREVLQDPPACEYEDERAGGEAQLIEKQRRQTVLDALDELSLEQRAVLVMCDIEGHSAPEASDALQVPLNTTYSRLRVARQEFAAAIRRRAVVRGEA